MVKTKRAESELQKSCIPVWAGNVSISPKTNLVFIHVGKVAKNNFNEIN